SRVSATQLWAGAVAWTRAPAFGPEWIGYSGVWHSRPSPGPQYAGAAAAIAHPERGRDLLPEARLWFGPLHLARARSLQDLHLVRGGRAQPGPARPSQTGIAPAQTGSFGVGGEHKPACLPLLAKRFFRPLLLFQREQRR